MPTTPESAPPRRVTVVGPVVPLRGGIAAHTTALCRVLAGRATLQVLSFRRQFPQRWYPGASQYTQAEPYRGADFSIDSMHPPTWSKALEAIADFAPDVVLIPWWSAYLGVCLGTIARGCRRRGLAVRYLCHNTVDHERRWWKAAVARLAWGYGSSFIVHTDRDRERIEQLQPGVDVRVVPFPSLEGFPAPAQPLPRRAELELLFFGFVRPYKGLEVLLESISLIRSKSVLLTVAGELWCPVEEVRDRIRRLGIEDRVELLPRYVDDVEVAGLFERADAVVLPYRSGGASGVAAIAYGFGKPIVASRIGGLTEVVDEEETGFLVEPGSPAALARVLEAEVSRERAAAMAAAIERRARSLTWGAVAREVLR